MKCEVEIKSVNHGSDPRVFVDEFPHHAGLTKRVRLLLPNVEVAIHTDKEGLHHFGEQIGLHDKRLKDQAAQAMADAINKAAEFGVTPDQLTTDDADGHG